MAAPSDSHDTTTSVNNTATRIASPTQLVLEDLLRRSVILREDWDALSSPVREEIRRSNEVERLLAQLVQHQLLTGYQAGCIRTSKMSGLLFGNYRVLDKLGAGGMGVVFKAEHLFLRRTVALKVLPGPFEDDVQHLARFLVEIRSVARLQHPNIVAALDAGKTRGSELEPPNYYYFVMEYVPGEDLELQVRRKGPLAAATACNLVCQVASALAEAHRHNLIHRDIKPSNILVTPDGQAKLLDFGLARRFHDRHLTVPGTVLGSLDYMAPEQAGAGSGIDHRADIYALGGVLCWCLLGKPPFPTRETFAAELAARQTQLPPSLHGARPDLPAELDLVVARMMALRPEDRYPTAQAVMNALLPYLKDQRSGIRSQGSGVRSQETGTEGQASDKQPLPAPVQRVLIADDSGTSRLFCRAVLQQAGIVCDEVSDGKQALEAIEDKGYDLVLLDINMPEIMGPDVLRRMREQPPCPNLKVIMLSGEVSPDEMAELLAAGADDYLPKPPSAPQLLGRVKAALSHKEAQDRSDLLNRHLLAVNAELERSLRASAGDLAQSRNALLLALAELAELRAGQSGAHLLRLQRYSRVLAEEASALPAFAGQIDANFIDMLECCVPLHDIGLAALPDHILRKAGKFDHEERLIMQTHTTLGADMLQGIARKHRFALTLLQMAADIARHHHECYDGKGYPDRLEGNAIPLSARITALGDVYDALRSPRPHRPALAHLLAVELMTEGSPGRFDPQLLQIFERCAPRFERIMRETLEH
jgi:response regulator RpfG family c-di-GMP phosphodiesterase/serine/threonine protein kinase